jgi:hypothetical protein
MSVDAGSWVRQFSVARAAGLALRFSPLARRLRFLDVLGVSHAGPLHARTRNPAFYPNRFERLTLLRDAFSRQRFA